MFNLNKEKPGFVPAKFVEMVLEFKELSPCHTVNIKDRSNGQSWHTSYELAMSLLRCSFKDYEANVRILDPDEDQDNIFRSEKKRVFAGFFAYDQILLQMLELPYTVWEDQSARMLVMVNDQLFYFGLVSEKDWPIVRSEEPRVGDVTLTDVHGVTAEADSGSAHQMK